MYLDTELQLDSSNNYSMKDGCQFHHVNSSANWFHFQCSEDNQAIQVYFQSVHRRYHELESDLQIM